jgi:hypothetical protein
MFSLNRINRFVLTIKTKCLSNEVGTESLNIIWTEFVLRELMCTSMSGYLGGGGLSVEIVARYDNGLFLSFTHQIKRLHNITICIRE